MEILKNSENNTHCASKKLFGNLLTLMDNGIIIFDLELNGIYNNISYILSKEIISTSYLGE